MTKATAKRSLITILVLLLAGLTAACGQLDALGGSGGGNSQSNKPIIPFGTCDRKAVLSFNICVESVGADYNDQGYLQILESSCLSTGGIYSKSRCDRTGSFGTCAVAVGQSNETYVTYYGPQYDATSALAACAGTPGGVFIPAN